MNRSGIREGKGDRARALIAAIAINGLLGGAFLAGLGTRAARHSPDAIKIFEVAIAPAHPTLKTPKPIRHIEERSPPRDRDEAAKTGRAPLENLAAVVGPDLPGGSGSATGSTGAGNGNESGDSRGGGVDGGQLRPAELIEGALGRKDYAAIRRLGLRTGSGDYLLLVTPSGTVQRCTAFRSSGSAGTDGALCGLLIQRLRFRPATKGDRPIYQEVHYVARWGHR